MQNQSSKWLDIRRDKPDLLVMYGWGAMNPTAIKEAVKAEFPMDKFVSIWWPERRGRGRRPATAPRASRKLNWHGTGANYPAFADIQKLVIDKGKSQTPKGEVGSVLYNRGVYNSVLIAEGIAEAQKITGKKVVTGEDVRRGLENINLDAGRFKALGLDGFAGPLKTTCSDHNSHSATFVQQWDGAKWVKVGRPRRPRHGQGPAAPRRGRDDLRREERLAGPQRALRQPVRTFLHTAEWGSAHPLPL